MSSDQGPHEVPARNAAQQSRNKNVQQIAPDGDIILRTPGESLATTEAGPDNGDASFLVSSAHLKLASPFFRALLSTRWSGAQAPTAGSPREVVLHEMNPNAVAVIMNVIHGQTRKIPQGITLGELVEFATMADFFQCAEAVELAAKLWVQPLKRHIPSYWTAEIPRWIMVSCVFHDQEALGKALKVAVEDGPSTLPTDGLPISGRIQGMSIPTTVS